MFTAKLIGGPLNGQFCEIQTMLPLLWIPRTFTDVKYLYELSGYTDYLYVRTESNVRAGESN